MSTLDRPPVKARVLHVPGWQRAPGVLFWRWQCPCGARLALNYRTHTEAITAATEHVRTRHRQQPLHHIPCEVVSETLTREQAEDELASIRRRAAELAWLLEQNLVVKGES